MEFEKYFANKGITVSFNTLGRTETLLQEYVAETQHLVSATEEQASQHIKHACYNLFYNMEPRQKFTGFEKFDNLANEFRAIISDDITESQFSPTTFVSKAPTEGNFIAALQQSLTEFPNHNLLYLSGGLDSELVARSMLDAGQAFTPVIFQWSNDVGDIKNTFDTKYAFAFCEKYSLTPIIKTINIETLWKSEEFKKLAIELQLGSPHLTTYAYAIVQLAKDYPLAAHLFGGEVRYRSNFVQDDGSETNIVMLSKVMPSYNGQTYTATFGIGTYSGMVYDQSGRWWKVVQGTGPWTSPFPSNPYAGPAAYSNSASGVFYEMRVTKAVAVNTGSGGGYLTNWGGGAWNILGNNIYVCDIAAGIGSWNGVGIGVLSADVTFTIDIRALGFTQIMTTTVRFVVYDGDGSQQPITIPAGSA